MYFAQHNVTDLGIGMKSRWNVHDLGFGFRSKHRHALNFVTEVYRCIALVASYFDID